MILSPPAPSIALHKNSSFSGRPYLAASSLPLAGHLFHKTVSQLGLLTRSRYTYGLPHGSGGKPFFKVRPVHFGSSLGLVTTTEPCSVARIMTGVEPIIGRAPGQSLELSLRDFSLRFADLTEIARTNNRQQASDDDHHDKQFQERKSLCFSFWQHSIHPLSWHATASNKKRQAAGYKEANGRGSGTGVGRRRGHNIRI